MSQPAAPKAPDPNKLYKAGIKTYLKYNPQLLQAEQAARAQYDPVRVEQALALQSKYGPEQYQQQLDALHQLDPQGTAIRKQLGDQVTGDLASGYNLPPELDKELTAQIRGAQAARGNILGNDAISAESMFKGGVANQLYQQHLQNAGSYLATPTPEQQLTLVSPVVPDRSSAYTNPNAGAAGQQFGLSNFQNQLAAFQLSGGGVNHWAGAAAGAASGAAAGTAVYPGIGTAVGAIGGGLAGYFSSAELKRNIKHHGLTKMGLPVVSFEYVSIPGRRFIGTIAEKVKEILPNAVFEVGGKLAVRYNLTDAPFHEIIA